MSTPTNSPQDDPGNGQPVAPHAKQAQTGEPTRQQSNQGAAGGSSLGDGPPPIANGDPAAHDAEHAKGEYGGGYGGQPKPKGR